MDCFDALQRTPRALKRAITFGEPGTFLHGPVILFDHIVKYLHWRKRTRAGSIPSAVSASTAEGYAGFLSTLMTPRHRITRGFYSFNKEAFGCGGITLRRQRGAEPI